MNLREYLRNEWSEYIRPLMVKDKCEFCGCDKNLHLHHIDRFHNLLVETLEELQLQELDIEFYDEMELKQISNFMLAKQIKSKYKTLCKTCHLKLHNKEKHSEEYKNNYYNPNGSYIVINKNIQKLDIPDNIMAKFIKIACYINYNNIIAISDKNKKIEYKHNDLKTIMSILNLGRTKTLNFLSFLKEKDLLKIDNETVFISKEYITKGYHNYNESFKVFCERYIGLYDSLGDVKKSKFIGKIINNYSNDIDYDRNKFNKNITEFNEDLNNLKLGYLFDNKIQINPNIIHQGALDYSYKNKIDMFKLKGNKEVS